MHSLPITMEIPTEATELGPTGALNIDNSVCKLHPASLADQYYESLRQAPARGQLAAALTQIGQEHTLGVVVIRATAQEQPAERVWTRQDPSDGRWWFGLAPTFDEASDGSPAAVVPERVEFVMQKRSDLATLVPSANEIRSESIEPTWTLSGRSA